MCGLAGIATAAWRPDHARRLGEASRRLQHRGPDGAGYLLWPAPMPGLRPVAAADALRRAEGDGPTVALAHRRLAIIDLSPAAGQPMVSGDGRYAVILNGEIYNYRELRAELQRAGRTFRTASDTEVLLEGFTVWGAGLWPRLIGMFALALFDTQRQHLFLVRDPFGIKPLFVAREGGHLCFASELGALLALRSAPPVARPQGVADFLQRHDTDLAGPTMLEGVERLPAGHLLEVSLAVPSASTPAAYWRPATVVRTGVPAAVAAAELRTLFLDEVRLHLRSDVPLGFALSGGLDSSAIIGAAREALGAAATLHAFAFVPEEAALSEEVFAEQAARAAGAELHRVRVRPEDLAAEWSDLAWHQGEPFHGPTIYAQRRVFQAAADAGLKVLLEGQGGDELLGGYDRYLVARAASLLRGGRIGAATALLAPLPGHRARHLLAAASLGFAPLGVLARRTRGWRRRAVDGGCWRQEWLDRHDVQLAYHAAEPIPGASPFRAALLRSVWGNPLQALLRFGDRNAMAASIENRVPFLTPRLANFLLTLPEDHLVAADGTRKAVLRAACRGWVPAPILERRDKVGFATPVVEWLLHLRPWADGLLRGLADQPLLDSRRMTLHWQAVQATRRLPAALEVWRWLSLQAWIERFGVRLS